MSELLPEDDQGTAIPEPGARSPVSPPLQGTAPAWGDSPQRLPVGEQRAHETDSVKFDHRFTLQHSGPGSLTGTAERIGSAVGAAQREVRRSLEVVRRVPDTLVFPSSVNVTEAAERTGKFARESVDHAARVVHEFEEEISDFRQQAARKLENLSEVAQERVLEFRRQLHGKVSRSSERARELADQFPLQTIAGIAGVCFALGVALRFRRSRRG